ncbi:MAG: CPBP family intramembrane metalloprotease [Oscillospiraceae bacterium]|nr:CPBP family intramembrane metalloprotease [Oscillospiraceae bacterium]
MDELETACAPKPEKPPYSRVGWSLFAILGIATGLQLVIALVVRAYAPEVMEASWFTWVLSFAPLYLVAIPLGYIIIKPLPKLTTPQQKLGVGRLVGFLAMSYAVMYIGNIVGTMLNAGISTLKGEELLNPLQALLTGSNLYFELAFVGILAPIIEELVFRKMLLDRIRAYGEGTAILVSGLTFGLFHGNLFQFFYAFGLGSLFAYIYLRTGRLRYTIILHAVINSFSVILSQLLLGNSNLETLQNMSGENPEELIEIIQSNLPQYLLVALSSMAVVVLFVCGLILLIKKRKQVVLFTAPKELPKEGRFKNVFVNWGMALFVLLSMGLMTYTVLA